MTTPAAVGRPERSRLSWVRLVVIASAGVALAMVMAATGGLPASDVTVLLGLSTGGAVIAGAAAAVALRGMRQSALSAQAAVAGLAPVLAVAVGITGAASSMFISSHDLWVLFVVLPGAGTVAVATALVLGRRVAQGAEELARRAVLIGDDGCTATQPAGGAASSRELVDAAAQLDAALARLSESRERTAALERNRRELVAWVSHDLRTPLSGIRAMAEALEDGVVSDPESVARYHATIRREADRLAGLVDDLFELSRLDAGAISLGLERVPIDDLLADAIAAATLAANDKGVRVEGSLEPGIPPIELSPPEMTRVVRNLLDNAIRHTPAGGAVYVGATTDESGEAVVVTVTDGCGGIPEPDLCRVFDLAFRGDAARTPGDGRAGLGLAIARGLVEVHEGDISVRNERGGCAFAVRLPVRAQGRNDG